MRKVNAIQSRLDSVHIYRTKCPLVLENENSNNNDDDEKKNKNQCNETQHETF